MRPFLPITDAELLYLEQTMPTSEVLGPLGKVIRRLRKAEERIRLIAESGCTGNMLAWSRADVIKGLSCTPEDRCSACRCQALMGNDRDAKPIDAGTHLRGWEVVPVARGGCGTCGLPLNGYGYVKSAVNGLVVCAACVPEPGKDATP